MLYANHPKFQSIGFIDTPKDVVSIASKLAAKSHASQKRKYTEEKYIVHPAAVALAVKKNNGSVEVEAAAWLHDTLEDTDLTYREIVVLCGTEVANLTLGCTDIITRGLKREDRLEKNIMHVKNGDERVQQIKMFDMLDNVKTIKDHDKPFAKIWIREKLEMIKAMDKLDRKTLTNLSIEMQRCLTEVESEAVQKWLGGRLQKPRI
jgi:guanosine-3',5'-bis(diphosphate) 3'-pyrophosphohydrolase